MALIKKVVFKNCALFTKCISRIISTQVQDASYTDVVMPMYKLTEYSNDNGITDFTEANATELFNFKAQLTSQTGNNNTKNVEITVPLKYLNNSQ